MADILLNSLMTGSNQFFFGKVVSADAGTYCVQVAPESSSTPGLMAGIPLTNIMASMMGIKECVLPQPGSTIFCYKQDAFSCLILGTVPDSERINIGQSFHSRATLGAGDSKALENNSQGYANTDTVPAGVSKLAIINNNRPTDVVDGEYVLANEFGVLLGLFQQFAVLKASELAQVQAFIYDDLVRIVSHNFEHFTCMGSGKVYQDGDKLTHEIGITHDSKEALGRANVSVMTNSTPLIDMPGKISLDDKDDFFALKKEGQLPIDRLKGFVGALGDFIHIILTRPLEGQLRALDGVPTGHYDKGLASVKMGLDGTLAFRSLGGIALEKTNWIRVPQRIKPVEGEETGITGVGAEESSDAGTGEGAPTKYTFDSSVSDRKSPFFYFLQLRDYLAYVLEGESYKQFANSSKFELNSDPSLETRVAGDLSLSPTQSGNFYNSTSGIYAMPNGGIVLRDAWGSAIVMEGGNIYLQPAKDLVAQPLRNLVAKVGQHVSIAARKDIDMSSTVGGFSLKTNLAQYLYSDTSGIILHSNAASASEFNPKEGVVTSVGGIVLNAPKSGLVTHASHSLFKTDNHTVFKSDLCMIDAKTRVLLRSNDGFDVFTKGDLILSAGKSLVNFTEGAAIFVGLKATALGIQKQSIAMSPMGVVEGLFEKKAFDDWNDRVTNIATSDFQEYAFGYHKDTDFDALKFRFKSSTAYGLTLKSDAIPQTIAQQEDESFHHQARLLAKWEEKKINDTYPYPGVGLEGMYATSALANLQFDATTQAAYNKALSHKTIGHLDFTDLFKEYRVYA